MKSTLTTLAIVLALVGVLVGVGATSGAPVAVACEKHKRDCHGGEGTSGPLTIRGSLITGLAPVEVLTVQAQLQGGQASGTVATTAPSGVNGPVRVIVPPGAGRAYYCINIDRADASGLDFNIYVLDVGNGITTFDRYALITADPAQNPRCSIVPAPNDFQSALGGNLTFTR